LSDNEYDVIVVGAGPAGSSAAYTAAKNGTNVALLEKEETVAQTVRTSGVTWIDYAKEFGIPEDCYNPIRTYNFCSPKNQVSISDEQAKAAVLDVRKTYRFLAEQAKNAGAKIFVNTNVTDVITEDGKVVGVKASSQGNEMIFRAKIVVDASGFQSVVSKSLGLVEQWKRFGVGAEYEVEAENVEEDTWWLMVGQMYSPAGYAWIFPLGRNLVRIGVGVGKPESDVDPTERLDKLIEEEVGPIKDLGKITKKEFHYGLIPNEGLSRKTVYDNLILVGDTAGMANPLVLEGIRYAIKYGRVAGDTASKAIKSGDTSEETLQKYEETWKKEIEPKIKSAHRVQAKWLALSDDDWDKEIDIISNLTADEFLDFVRADFTVAKMVKLATHHPMLAVRQLFNIVKGA
jgi:digeranylgeranylglycerophospholipid reductase